LTKERQKHRTAMENLQDKTIFNGKSDQRKLLQMPNKKFKDKSLKWKAGYSSKKK
jgi:hypothetical protein